MGTGSLSLKSSELLVTVPAPAGPGGVVRGASLPVAAAAATYFKSLTVIMMAQWPPCRTRGDGALDRVQIAVAEFSLAESNASAGCQHLGASLSGDSDRVRRSLGGTGSTEGRTRISSAST